MKHASTRNAIGAIAVALALIVTACSSSGGDDADKKDTTTTEAEKTTTTTGDDEETTTTEADDDDGGDAQGRAEAVVLSESDFPEGWSSAPRDESDDEASPLTECDPSFGDDSDELAAFADDNFVTGDLAAGDGSQFSLETKVFEDEDAAVAAIAPFADAAVLACADEKLKEEFGTDGATVEGEFVEDNGYPVTTADEAIGASANYTITGPDGSSIPVIVAVLVVRTGDLASQIVILSVGESLNPADLEGPITKVEELQAA